MVTFHFHKALGRPSQGQDCLVFPKLPHASVHPACEEGQLLGPSLLISTPKPIWTENRAASPVQGKFFKAAGEGNFGDF